MSSSKYKVIANYKTEKSAVNKCISLVKTTGKTYCYYWDGFFKTWNVKIGNKLPDPSNGVIVRYRGNKVILCYGE